METVRTDVEMLSVFNLQCYCNPVREMAACGEHDQFHATLHSPACLSRLRFCLARGIEVSMYQSLVRPASPQICLVAYSGCRIRLHGPPLYQHAASGGFLQLGQANHSCA